MKIKLLKVISICIVLAFNICVSQVTVFAATLGDKLSVPEDGWTRYDDDNSSIEYLGTWENDNVSGNYKGTTHYTYTKGVMKIKFYGTKVRLLMNRSSAQTKEVAVTIDGKKYDSFSNYSSSTNRTVLAFEETNLKSDFHTLSVVSTADGHMAVDAIDIDATGYLLPYNKIANLKASAGDLKVDLTWDAITTTTSYTIKRSTTAGGPYTTIATDVTDTTYTDTDVTNGTTYYYVVATIVDGRENSNSDETSATPNVGQTVPTEDAKLKVVLEVAESLRLSVDDDLDVNTEMAWSSSDETVATVNEKGIVTASGLGNTVITVKSIDGSYTDSINVLVVDNADDYRLAIGLKVGETRRLTVDDLTDTVNVTWAPMDSSIANVTSKGKVTALSKGLVLMTAKDEEGNIIGKVYVRVRE